MDTDKHVLLLERALDALLTALSENKERQRSLRAMVQQDLESSEPDQMDGEQEIAGQPRLQRLIADPVQIACRSEIKKIGRVLFDVTGSTHAMRAAFERVTTLHPESEKTRAKILERAWAGVGKDDDVWAA